MAGASTAALTVQILVDGAKAAQGLNETASRFESFAGKAAKVFAGAFAADKIVDGIKTVVNAASDLQQAVGGTDKVFGDSSQKIHAWASDQSDSIRLSQRSWEQYATSIGASLRATGAPMSTVADQTHNLMQVSADFAATFGRDIGDVANAVRAALTGEYDSLQNMGVAISGATVNAEALRIAQGDTALATTDAVKAQAAYNVIMQQGSLYSGQAAEEATTFTGRVDDLKAKLDDAAGTIGGPLLDAFGGLIDQASSAVPFLEAIATGLATVLAWALQLPGPLQAGAVAMAAFAIAANAGWISSLVAGWREMIVMAQLSKIAFAEAGGGIRGVGAAASFALSPLKGFAAAIGPGLAIGAAVVAITAIIDKVTAAGKAFDAAGDDLSDVTDELRKTGGSWTDTARKMYQAKFVNTDAFKQLVEQGFSANEILTALTGTYDQWYQMQASERGSGLTTDTINQVNAYRDQAAVLPQLAAAQGQYNDLVGQGADATNAATDATTDYAQVLKDTQDAMSALADSTTAAGWLTEQQMAMDQASRAADIYAASMDRALGRRTDYQRTTLDWADGIRDVAGAFKDAAEKGAINRDALKDWDIGALSATETGSKLAGSLLDQSQKFSEFVTQAFEASGGANNLNTALGAAHTAADTAYSSFIAMATAAGLSGDEAAALAQQLGIVDAQHIDDKVFDIIAKDEEAQMKAKLWETVKFNDKTLQFEASFPAGQEIADKLNAEYGLIKPTAVQVPVEIGTPKAPPGLFGQIIANAPGSTYQTGTVQIPTQVQTPQATTGGGAAGAAATSSAGSSVQGATVQVPVTVESSSLSALQGQLADIATRSVNLVVTATTDQAWGAIQLLSSAAAAVPAVVQVTAESGAAQSAINNITSGAYSVTVNVLGDNNDAIRAVRAVTTGVYSVTIQVLGNNDEAIRAIRNVTTGRYDTTVYINGDNSGAISAIRSITTGYYSATVYIGANADGFWQVYNSLPSTKNISVTQTVTTIPSAPSSVPEGFAAPLAADAMAAPMAVASAGPRSVTTGGAGGGPTIIVQGALDPDAVARQIRRLLVGRDRRSGGVVAGGVRRAV